MSDIRAASAWTTNAHLIEAVHELGYLADDSYTLDPTFGLGKWWKRWAPHRLEASDLDAEKSPTGTSISFTDLPHADDTFDVVAFDPPYKLCLDSETEILTRRGWLDCATVRPGDIAYSMNPETGAGEWKPVTAVHIYPDEPTKVAVCEGKNLNFVATPEHRWLVRSEKGFLRWKVTEDISTGDRIPHSAAWAGLPAEPIHDDAFVELVAWFWTEGTLDSPSTYGHITQSHVVNPIYCHRIAECLRSVYGDPVDSFGRSGRTSVAAWRIKDEDRNRRFIFSATIGADLSHYAPNRVPSLEFLESLTQHQLNLFIAASVAADGCSAGLSQADPERAHAFAMACVLAGRPIATADRGDGNGHVITLKARHYSKPSRPGITVGFRQATVWCPTVADNGTWLARRKGRVYFTGNSGTPSTPAFDARYGVDVVSRWQDRMRLCIDGITECDRVLKPGGILLVKCQDQVCSGKVRWQTLEFTNHAVGDLGMTLVDSLLMLGGRAQPAGRRQVHARRNYSTLLVLEKARMRT